jgi:hypothetical protein
VSLISDLENSILNRRYAAGGRERDDHRPIPVISLEENVGRTTKQKRADDEAEEKADN